MVISVDFDGTCVTHEYPFIGKSIGAEVVLREIENAGHKIILLTMRDSYKSVKRYNTDVLKDAVKWFKINGIQLYGINENPTQTNWSKSRKVYADIYIDDQFLGCPVSQNAEISSRPFVDWVEVARKLTLLEVISVDAYNRIHEKLHENYPTIYRQ